MPNVVALEDVRSIEEEEVRARDESLDLDGGGAGVMPSKKGDDGGLPQWGRLSVQLSERTHRKLLPLGRPDAVTGRAPTVGEVASTTQLVSIAKAFFTGEDHLVLCFFSK